MWVMWEIESVTVSIEVTSPPIHNIATNIRVIGMPLSFPVIEASKINAKTTPLAPNNITPGWKILLQMPVTRAVTTMTMIIRSWYFSSNIGPSNKI